MRTTTFMLSGALLALAGCRVEPTDSSFEMERLAATTDVVQAARVTGGVRITNGTSRGIAYAVRNPNWLGLLATCADPGPGCVRLAAGRSVVVPEREFHGWADVPDGAKALGVLWWHVEPDGAGGHRAGEVHDLPVQ